MTELPDERAAADERVAAFTDERVAIGLPTNA